MYNRLMKVLFFDIDGTLAVKKKIVPSALEALKKLKKKAIKPLSAVDVRLFM